MLTTRSRSTAAGLAALTLIVIALALVGCKTEVIAPAADATTQNTITASGNGTTLAAPDTAELTFGIASTDPKAKPALDRASKTADAVAAALKKAGVAAADIQTANMRVDPNYVYDNNGEKPPTVASYRATIELRVKVRDMEILGTVIEAGTAAGAASVNGPTFTLDDDAAATDEAITKAVEDAKRRAQAMAKATGKKVGDAVVIKETSVEVPTVYQDSALMRGYAGQADNAAAIAVEAGQLDITADITVVFRLE